tara:strand:+ start:502 stop:1350 length:849 start_codon:yes stop_codon:yes gene_type:complete
MARKKLLTEGEVRQFMKLANLGPLSENYFDNNPLDEQEEEELDLEMGAEEEVPGGEEELGLDVEDEVEMGDEGDPENEELLARVVQAVADELGVEVDVEGAAGEEGGEEELEVGAELEEPLPGGGELEMGAEEEEEIPGMRDMYENKPYTAKKEKPGADLRKGAENEAALAESADVLAQVVNDLSTSGLDMELAQSLASMVVPTVLAALGIAGAPDRGLGPEAQAIAHGEDEEEAAMAAGLAEDSIVAEVSRRVAARLMRDKKKEEVAGQLAERIFNRLTQK